jgi:hypothetical protein
VDAVFEIALVPVGVPVPIVTGTLIALPVELAAIAVVEVHEIVDEPIPVHNHPGPPVAAPAVRLPGNVSVTVIVPDVAVVPVFFGVIVYAAPD